jgi:hypothetical protein
MKTFNVTITLATGKNCDTYKKIIDDLDYKIEMLKSIDTSSFCHNKHMAIFDSIGIINSVRKEVFIKYEHHKKYTEMVRSNTYTVGRDL